MALKGPFWAPKRPSRGVLGPFLAKTLHFWHVGNKNPEIYGVLGQFGGKFWPIWASKKALFRIWANVWPKNTYFTVVFRYPCAFYNSFGALKGPFTQYF